MLTIQIILLLFFLFAIFRVVNRWKKGQMTMSIALIWILFWLIGGVIVILPDSTFYFAKLVGVGRGADLILYIGITALFFMVFRLMVRINSLDKDITKLTRKIALQEDMKTQEHENTRT